ncbi:MAG: 4Fe-4S dicluster domain-containing protein [Candidatus Aminicenantes bacterium]|nr:4Fe-4S dicluster domain-containing protein [Candidatus Aminicenantes bacterium]
MLSTVGKIIFTLVILATAAAFLLPVWRRLRIIMSGQPDSRFTKPLKRIWEGLTKILFQRCTLKNERIWTGFMHIFIFYSALTFDTMTVNHTLEGFFPGFHLFGDTKFGLFFSLWVDCMAVAVMIGVVFFAVRRFIIRPKAYRTTLLDSAVIYLFLTAVTLSYLYFEVFAIAHHPETAGLSWLGVALGGWLNTSALSAAAVSSYFLISWWLHILVVFGFIAYVPYSKYFHMFAGSVNMFVRKGGPLGELKSMDLENSDVFGIEKAMDYSWKDLLDSFACMECGRCQDVCPAFATDKPLSPKMIIFNLKNHLLDGYKAVTGGRREDLNNLMDGVFTEGEMWTCTTCGACMHVCPVEIEHIPKIIGVRQSQVLMESKFPQELNTFFRNMETNSNPWGMGFADRAAWTEGQNVNLYKDVPDAEYLFWVGCAGSFDEEGKKIAAAMASLLNKAGITFGILGTEEKCCGDSAKRLGNEYLFQMQAAENIAAFMRYGVKNIITTCPHGYNTLKNEYPQLADVLPDLSAEDKSAVKGMKVVHHVQLLKELIVAGRLTLKEPLKTSITYHDSCYLGRHNGIVREPRDILKKVVGGNIRELPDNREHSFCCGAGGGLMWTEESLGTRINHTRTDQVLASQVEAVATSCPFCQTMLQDGLKDKGNEDIKVRDIAQIVDELT